VGAATSVKDCTLACTSTREVSERYEAALVGKLDVDLNVFLGRVWGLMAMGGYKSPGFSVVLAFRHPTPRDLKIRSQ